MAYEHIAGFQTYEHLPPANTRTHYTNISFYDTVAQSTSNTRTCQRTCQRTCPYHVHPNTLYEHAKMMIFCPDFTAENAP